MKTNIIKALLGLILTLSISGLYAQSPRIKLNQIVKDTISGSVLISNLADSNMVYSRNFYINAADTSLVFFGTTIVAGGGGVGSFVTLPQLTDSLALYATKVQLSDSMATVLKQVATDLTLTGDGTGASPLKVDTSVIATVSALRDSLAGIISSVSTDVTLTGDGSVGNPLKVDTTTYIATKGDLNLKQDQLNGTGFVKATGTTISYDNSTYLTTEVDGSVTNELQTISYNSGTNTLSLSDGGGTADLSNLALVDSTRINATGDTALYYQNGVLIGTGAIAGGGGGGSGTVTDITAGTFLSGGTITTSGTIALDTASAGLKTYISDNSAGGTTFNNLSETADTVFVSKFLNVDTATLYVDAFNNMVGIGTSSPSAKLNVNGQLLVNGSYIASQTNMSLGEWTGIPDPDDILEHSSITGDLFVGNVGNDVGRLRLASNSNGGIIIFNGYYNNTVQQSYPIDSTKSYWRVDLRGNSASTNDDRFAIFRSYTGAKSISEVEYFRITGSGNVGIGTNAPAYTLDVNGNVRADTYYYDLGSSLVSSSDVRLKKNISEMQSTLNKIKSLNLVKYEWNDIMFNKLEGRSSQSKLSGIFEGMIAQEVESIFPQYVGQDADGFKTLSYVSFIVPLIKATQEQQAIIETQQQEIETLKTQYNDLLQRIINLENK